jgi:hypothetical protein
MSSKKNLWKTKLHAALNRESCILVFPLANQSDPPSLWRELFPKKKMVWEWTDDGDDDVPRLWQFREEMSRSGEVLYAKWFQNRATFFAKDHAPLWIRALNPSFSESGLSHAAKAILHALQDSSPQSTKALKKATQLKGRDFEKDFQSGLKQLSQRLLVVGFGEIDDGAFPSLAWGATELLFEKEYSAAKNLDHNNAQHLVLQKIASPKVKRFYQKLCQQNLSPNHLHNNG